MCKSRSSRIVLAVLTGALVALAGLGGSYVVPLDHDAIQYATRPVTDPVAKLQQGLASGEVTLEFDESTGYLPAVLKALNVPRESQILVFSKTSFQAPRISPRSRARSISTICQRWLGARRRRVEVASIDPKQGVIFYTLDQNRKPRFDRRELPPMPSVGRDSRYSGDRSPVGISGAFRHADVPQAGTFITDHRSPFKERWGGWYVSGKHGSQFHMGNAVVRDRDRPDDSRGKEAQNLTDLREASRHRSPTSRPTVTSWRS